MYVDKAFVSRLYNSGDDASWRAAKTIEELQEQLEKRENEIRKMHSLIINSPIFNSGLGGVSKPYYESVFESADSLEILMTEFNKRFFDAKGKLFEFRWGNFEEVEKS